MPANKEAFIRYRIIDQCLRNKQRMYPTLAEIADECTHLLGKTFSESTIQKDIYAMRFDEGLGFEAPIEYSKLHKGYYYKDENYSISNIPLKEEDLMAIEFAAGILRQFRGTGMLGRFEDAIGKIMETVNISRALGEEDFNQIIQVEENTANSVQWLEELTKHIIARQVVQFHYHSFSSGKESEKIVHPYLLKEYRNRWYLIGWSKKDEAMRTYGLDRMSNLSTIKEKYYRHKAFNAADFFRYSFGITVGNMVPEEIVLQFTGFDILFVKSQPLHNTQKIISDKKDTLTIALKVIPSPELTMASRSFGASVKVLQPEWLAKEIRTNAQSVLNQYKDA
jgi:predicted DNA-binding transcriptional regulator YafY